MKLANPKISINDEKIKIKPYALSFSSNKKSKRTILEIPMTSTSSIPILTCGSAVDIFVDGDDHNVSLNKKNLVIKNITLKIEVEEV